MPANDAIPCAGCNEAPEYRAVRIWTVDGQRFHVCDRCEGKIVSQWLRTTYGTDFDVPAKRHA